MFSNIDTYDDYLYYISKNNNIVIISVEYDKLIISNNDKT